jgi:hypothetical protein
MIDCTDIERVLGPIRKFDGRDQGIIWLSLEHNQALSLVAPPGRREAWAAVQWSDTMAPPIADWLGNTKEVSTHADVLQRMRVATFIAFMNEVPILSHDHPWCLINHQTAGHACNQVRFVGRRVSVKPEIEFRFMEIATFWYNKQLGWDLPSLSELTNYRSQLQQIGFDCDRSDTFRHLKEGLYPIDITQAVIDQVCQRPFALESLIGSPRPYGKIEHYAVLVFIAPNSD